MNVSPTLCGTLHTLKICVSFWSSKLAARLASICCAWQPSRGEGRVGRAARMAPVGAEHSGKTGALLPVSQSRPERPMHCGVFLGLCWSLAEMAPETCLSEKCGRPSRNRSDGSPLWTSRGQGPGPRVFELDSALPLPALPLPKLLPAD